MFSIRARLRFVEVAAIAQGVHGPLGDAADENRERRGERQIHADGEQHGALHLEHDHRDAQRHSRENQRPRHIAADDALRDRCHQSGLGSWELPVAEADSARVDVSDMKHQKREVHHETRNDDRDKLDDLNRPRRAAEDVADFEVLQQLAGNRRRHADDSRHAENRDHTGCSRDAKRNHQQAPR